jgi:hypothetical protein
MRPIAGSADNRSRSLRLARDPLCDSGCYQDAPKFNYNGSAGGGLFKIAHPGRDTHRIGIDRDRTSDSELEFLEISDTGQSYTDEFPKMVAS